LRESKSCKESAKAAQSPWEYQYAYSDDQMEAAVTASTTDGIAPVLRGATVQEMREPIREWDLLEPVLFVVDCDPGSLEAMLSDLSGRFGKDFTVTGETAPEAALAALAEMAAADQPVALLLVDHTASDFLARAHKLHPRAKRVLIVDRDYSSTSPAVQAVTLGRADYHIVRPWSDDEMMYGAITEYLSSWEIEQKPNFELLRIVAEEGDSRVPPLRDVITRFGLPFGFYATESENGRRLLHEAGLATTRLPVGSATTARSRSIRVCRISPAPSG
jgi:hypothetical protein